MAASKAKATGAFLSTLFEEAPFGVALLDADGRYERVNRRLAEIHGIPVDEHPGRSIADLLPHAAPLVQPVIDRVLRTGRAQTFRSTALSGEDREQRQWALSCHPVAEDGETVGVVVVVVDSGSAVDLEEVAQVLELERSLRGRAESAGRRAEFLAEATTALDSSLDLRTTLRTLAAIAVPELADLCLVDMLTGRRGEVRRLAVAHRDHSEEARIWDMTRRWPSAPDLERGIRRVLAQGRTEVNAEITEGVLAAAFPDPEHRARVRALGLSAAVIVPIRARGRTLGAITFAQLGQGRSFSDEDVELAEELTRRASLAVDNARLHTDLRRADRSQRLLAEASRILSASLDWTSTVEHLAELLTTDFADLCAVERPDPGGAVHAVALAGRDPELVRQAADTLRREAGPAALREDSVLVRSLGEDERFPGLRALGATSLLSVPMVARGRPVGAISLAMTIAGREFDEDDLRLVEEIGRRAGVAADNARLYAERTRVARTLQRSLMPSRLPLIPGIESAVRFRGAGDGSEVGGDFYDVFGLDDGAWCAVVGDVCGKGAEAAGLTALARHTVRAAARYERRPAGVLRALNDAIAMQSPSLIFATAALAYVRPGAGPDGAASVRVARGGHLPPLVLRAGGTVEAMMVPGALLGAFETIELGEEEVVLEAGDAIVFYTDGVTEAGAPERPLGEDGVREELSALAGKPADAIARRLETLARAAGEGVQRDDIAVLVLRFTG